MPPPVSAATRWRGILDAFRKSGLTQAEFCRQHGLSLNTLRKYLYGARAVAKSPTVVEFLPVTTTQVTQENPTQTHHHADPIVLILDSGRRVAVAPGFDSPTLTRLIETIEGHA